MTISSQARPIPCSKRVGRGGRAGFGRGSLRRNRSVGEKGDNEGVIVGGYLRGGPLFLRAEVRALRPSQGKCGLDGAGKIGKDMRTTAKPQIGPRRSCFDEGSCGVAEQ